MPNWCDNKLTLRNCRPQEYIAFVKKYFDKQGDFDFNRVIPEPKRKKDCPSEFWVTPDSHVCQEKDKPWFDWYEWHCAMWGTKWNSDGTACMPIKEAAKLDPDSFRDFDIYFETAWSPAIPVIEALIEQCPAIDIVCSFYEGGCWFAGYIDETGVNYCDDSEVKDFAISECFAYPEDFMSDEDEEENNNEA